MNAELTEMFRKVDLMSADGFVSYLASDVKFRFGNAPELVGKANVLAGIEAFFANIAGLEHVLVDEWTERGTTILRFDTHYTRHDRSIFVAPCCAVLQFNGEGLIDDYRIYADVSPLFSG
ncbi:nuclear transport factor 2 family protein [Pseudomonas putida]|uniref:nuclear transport factor 2 family protein n=1 Tax=Pseudomonas putida TaxID=303 RepID=UPI0023638E0E|nr:nuclear transport factor 2 family protein [Pseudomonas putida]MDD2067793.1 nuclear transport factor 2 family protein [Pseudomonas putida]HDS1738320.1 nuclear transport factor 2 family protein [Pseudomonas putida]